MAAAEVDVSLRAHPAGRYRDSESCGDRLQRHPGTPDERLEQHVARAEERALAAGRRMRTSFTSGFENSRIVSGTHYPEAGPREAGTM